MGILVSALWRGEFYMLVTGHLTKKLNWVEMSPGKVEFHLPSQEQVCSLFSEFQMLPNISRYHTNMKCTDFIFRI